MSRQPPNSSSKASPNTSNQKGQPDIRRHELAKLGLSSSSAWGADIGDTLAVEYYLDPDGTTGAPPLPNAVAGPAPAPSLYAEVWDDVIRHPYIPYGLEERRDTLAHAFKELDYYIKKWERRGPDG